MFMVGDFTLYFDESYSYSPEARVYTVGGYLSTDVQWKKFRKEWRETLEAQGLDYFHMVDFQACKRPYDVWTKEKRAHFLASLHHVIHKRTLMSFATTADIEGFENLTPEQRNVLVSPHVFAAKNCMKQVGFWAAENIINYPVIAYIFEEGQPHERQMARLVETLTDEDKWFFRMASLIFAKKKSLNPLQAADVVAYESMKEIARSINPLNKRGSRLSGINLARDRTRNQWLFCGEYDFIASIKSAELRAKDYADRHPDPRNQRANEA
jgi:Protein of unknown function (DUF3800)